MEASVARRAPSRRVSWACCLFFHCPSAARKKRAKETGGAANCWERRWWMRRSRQCQLWAISGGEIRRARDLRLCCSTRGAAWSLEHGRLVSKEEKQFSFRTASLRSEVVRGGGQHWLWTVLARGCTAFRVVTGGRPDVICREHHAASACERRWCGIGHEIESVKRSARRGVPHGGQGISRPNALPTQRKACISCCLCTEMQRESEGEGRATGKEPDSVVNERPASPWHLACCLHFHSISREKCRDAKATSCLCTSVQSHRARDAKWARL